MNIRTYEPRDEAAVIALWTELFGYPQARNDPAKILRDKLTHDGHDDRDLVLLLVAEHEGQLIGTVMAGYDGHRGWLYRAGVKPALRQRGIARALVTEAESRLRELGCTKVNLQVIEGGTEAVAFWSSVGYLIEPRVSLGKDLSGIPGDEGGC